MLSSLDVLIILKVCAKRGRPWTQQQLAQELFISQASVHLALKAAEAVRLYSAKRKEPNVVRLEEALVHGAPYFLAPRRGGEARGMPTSWAAPPLSEHLSAADAFIPVWPDPEGEVRGIAFEPLHKAVPQAARLDPLLYELLTLVDALREGGARQSKLAQKLLGERLRG